MDEMEFERILNLFPIVRPRHFQYVDSASSRPQHQHEISQHPLHTHPPIHHLDTFWIKLQTVAENKVGAADAEIFCKGFRKIYNKLVKELSLDAARNLLSASSSYGQ